MNNIITEQNCIRINDALIAKNTIKVVQILSGIRIVFNTGITQDLKVSESKIDGVAVNNAAELFDYFKQNAFSIGGGDGGNGVTGNERQVVGFGPDGSQLAVTLGWAQLSDQPRPPQFDNGVLTMSKVNGEDQFGMIQVAVDENYESIVTPNAIPFYKPGTIGTGGGVLPVADAISDDDAINLRQLNIRVPSPPLTGNFVLKSVNGVISWVSE